jgi:hypothetical protein
MHSLNLARAAVLAGMLTLAASSAAGSEGVRQDGHILNISGEITAAMSVEVLALMPDDIRVVSLNSIGGNVRDALAIARWVRANNIRSHVAAGAECSSSCTIIFQGGVVRSAHPTARFLYHYGRVKEADEKADTIGRAMATIEYLEALISLGAPTSLYRLVPADRDWTLTADEARKFRILHVVALDESGLSEN